MKVRRLFVAALALLSLVASPLVASGADERSVLTGKITDQDGRAVPFASVAVPGARTGGLSDSEGQYRIAGIPGGTYTVKVNFMGYEPVAEEVTLEAGKTLQKNFRLKQIVVRREKEIVVTADRPLVEVRSSATVRAVNSDDIRKMPVQTLEQVLELQTGVSKTNDEIHLRGGRADEVTYIVDGAKTRDLITGKGTAGQISAGSVAEVGVITGGFDAEYGQALSGVVQVRLKEGTERYHGRLEYRTDHFLGINGPLNFLHSDRLNGSSFNSDGATMQVDGPEPITRMLGLNKESRLTFLASVNSEFSSTYLNSIDDARGPNGQGLSLRPDYRDSFLGLLFSYPGMFSPRADNKWNGLYKLSYRPRPSDKLFVSFNKSLGIDEGFGRHLASDITDDRNTYPYRWSHRWDHAAVDVEDNSTLAGNWTHVYGTQTVQQIQLSRTVGVLHVGVQGKNNLDAPWREYVEPNDDIYKVSTDSLTRLKAYDIFVDSGDDSIFEDRYSRETSLSYSINRTTRHHDLKMGAELNLQEVQFIDIENPWDVDPDTLGSKHDIFHVKPATGVAFLRDKIEYEGFVADVGLRWDVFIPGSVADAAIDSELADSASRPNISRTVATGYRDETFNLFGRRAKGHLSPRISVSHPITDRDNFYFNYGEFTQWPAYYYIYSKMGSLSSENFPQIGNLNLDPTVSIQYELGGRHQISDYLAANVSFYQKDTYGYPTLAYSQRSQGNSTAPFSIYLNSDFSRSRGIEVEIERRRSKFYSALVTYEYSTIRAKSSTPNQLKIIQELGGDTQVARVGEEVAYWHRPHQARLRLSCSTRDEAERPRLAGLLMLPRNFSATLDMSLRSGRAYTPSVVQLSYDPKDSTVTVNALATGAAYSANAPMEFTASLKLDQQFSVFGRSIHASLEGTNILNSGLAKFIDPTTGRGYEDGKGLWGHYEVTDIQKYRHQEIVANPSVNNPPANYRLSLSYDF
ncbi:MAG TPA: TonB-dependent receptor [Candidatus Saccharimonadales bacterium]|nr:TonB-dependent receptor [Candidatus Saccharimonadales bacterium]